MPPLHLGLNDYSVSQHHQHTDPIMNTLQQQTGH